MPTISSSSLRRRLVTLGAGAALALASIVGVGLAPSPAVAATTSARSTSCTSGLKAAGARVCVSKSDTRGAKVVAAIKDLAAKTSQKAVLFSVWQNGKQITTGAVGTSYPGVPAAADMHFRIGNVTESMECTLLLHLVDEKKISLDDRVSTWLPTLPHGDEVTVGQLANNTSGYASFYTDAWTAAFHADPFRAWTPAQMIALGVDQPLTFAPGTNWAFSDTNFMILGQIIQKAGKASIASQIDKLILKPLHLKNTHMTPTSYIPSPVLHGYDSERGDYQDSTFWSISWASTIGDMTSTLPDLITWSKALGTGKLLSSASHAKQLAPDTAGLGPLTAEKYNGLGLAVVNSWIVTNPNVPGYYVAMAYLPSEKISVAIVATPGPSSPSNVHLAVKDFNAVSAIMAPSKPADVPGG